MQRQYKMWIQAHFVLIQQDILNKEDELNIKEPMPNPSTILVLFLTATHYRFQFGNPNDESLVGYKTVIKRQTTETFISFVSLNHNEKTVFCYICTNNFKMIKLICRQISLMSCF